MGWPVELIAKILFVFDAQKSTLSCASVTMPASWFIKYAGASFMPGASMIVHFCFGVAGSVICQMTLLRMSDRRMRPSLVEQAY